jgi:hypothetical protein
MSFDNQRNKENEGIPSQGLPILVELLVVGREQTDSGYNQRDRREEAFGEGNSDKRRLNTDKFKRHLIVRT